ncbi:MAG: DUF2490 domain-containing protein [Sphingobacteriaceae bacterium]|nr:DUF2490 domain-containing protein [Sphingobacteriaceae bacterium]
MSDKLWLQYYGQLKISTKWQAAGDVGLRFNSSGFLRQASLGRIGISYYVNKNLSFTAGAAYFNQNNMERITKEEWRGWQEIQFIQNISKLILSHRARIEQRKFHSLETNICDFNFRYRYRLLFSIPLNHKTITEKTIYSQFGNEIFYSTINKVTFFDQNRILVGIGYKLNKKLVINLNYVLQHDNKFKNKNTIIWLGIVQTFGIK